MIRLKKIVIFYFSGTGNTWWVTGRLAEFLMEMGTATTYFSIEQVNTEQADYLIAECDIVGFGYPVYGSDVPEIMKDFMRRLAPFEKVAFIYCTQWMWSGDGARVGTEFLPRKVRIRWAEHFAMPNNVSVSVIRLPYTNDKRRIKKTLNKADRKIQRFAQRIMSERSFLRGFNPVSVFSGYIQRGPFRYAYERLKDDISVDKVKCTCCGYCVKLCPARNLLLEGDTIQTRGSCILCLRCYSFCPEMAVEYINKPHNPGRGEPYRGPVNGFDPQVMQ
jgi:flavodoxin/Pyruvate/2-oxoacid:ferredoxin oxidoreductase delta subunit